jgi:Cu+-exporting ATPase
MQELGIAITKKPLNSLFFIADDSKLLATFELKDQLKEGAKETIANLKKLGLKIVMLTGDHDQSAQAIAQEAGITEYHAELLPQDKAAFIDELKSKGEIVTMVGDGINDSIALSKSNIAIAMGGGADVAIGVSDVVLIDESVKKIEDAFKISRRSYRAIKENISFSIIYNIIAVPMAIMGYVYPLVAALSMSLSSLVVVGNSIRIKRLRFKEKN